MAPLPAPEPQQFQVTAPSATGATVAIPAAPGPAAAGAIVLHEFQPLGDHAAGARPDAPDAAAERRADGSDRRARPAPAEGARHRRAGARFGDRARPGSGQSRRRTRQRRVDRGTAKSSWSTKSSAFASPRSSWETDVRRHPHLVRAADLLARRRHRIDVGGGHRVAQARARHRHRAPRERRRDRADRAPVARTQLVDRGRQSR